MGDRDMLGKAKFYKNGYQILRKKILEDFYVKIFNNMDSIADDFQKIIDYHTDDKIVDTIDYLLELIESFRAETPGFSHGDEPGVFLA